MTQAMSTPEIKRGQVYYIQQNMDGQVYDGVLSSNGRPGVIVSSEFGIQQTPIVHVVYCTSAPKRNSVSVSVRLKNRTSTALCNQIATVSKVQLMTYICDLTEHEMEWIDKKLANALGLREPQPKVEPEPVKDETDEAIELAFYKKAYEKLLNELVEVRIDRDMLRLNQQRVIEEPVYEEEYLELEPEPEEEPEETEPVDINTCSAGDLKKLGFTNEVCNNIIACRPYEYTYELKPVPGVTRLAFELVKNKITVSQPQPEPEPVVDPEPPVIEGKININTATGKIIQSMLGVPSYVAYSISGYRGKNGSYTSVEDLQNVKNVPKVWYERIKDRVTV